MSAGVLLVAHGSRTGGSQEVVRQLAGQVSMLASGLETAAAFLDHDEVTPDIGLRLLKAHGCTSAVVVPVLLTSAYHVNDDLPARLGDMMPVRITAHLGPDLRVITALASRLPEDAESVVLCAAGSSDSRVHIELGIAASQLETLIDRRVVPAYLSSAEPSLEEAVVGLYQPVIASYLLAEGFFSDDLATRAAAIGARHTEVIGAHPQIAALIAQRVRDVLHTSG